MDFLQGNDDTKIIKFFQKIGIIGTKAPVCKRCSVDMKWCVKKDNIDKVAWRCTKNNCGSSVSIRKGSFLECFNKDLHCFLKLLYHWAVKTPHKVIERELKISRNTITAWQQKFKLVAVKALDRNNYILGAYKWCRVELVFL